MNEFPTILITGGAGSFGRACASFLLRHNMAAAVRIYSRGEHLQASMFQALGRDERLRMLIGDVRDRERLTFAMRGCDLVIHAAALKRIEVGKHNPEEMVKTNVGGSMNVVAAARAAGVERVVGLSTDKAVFGISPYGVSKAMMEHILLAANETQGAVGPRFVITRYGNVNGSAGSIIPTWSEMVRQGARELPTSDPECTRFAMKISEAVELVLGAACDPDPGDIAIPELPAYRVGDLAEAFGLPMRVTGLPRYERRHEMMKEGHSSEFARRLSVPELREIIRECSQ